MAQADAYYEHRGNLDNVRKALTLMRAAVTAHPARYEGWWRIARYDCYLARHLPDNQQIPLLEEGVSAGKKAEHLDPNRVEGHFWTGTDEGLLAEDRGVWGGLRYVYPVRDEMQTAMKLDRNYQEDGAERILGRLYYEAPFFKGGDRELSIRLLENCLKRYPHNSLTMLYLADSYRAVDRREDARNMLEKILKLTSSSARKRDRELPANQSAALRELREYFHQSG